MSETNLYRLVFSNGWVDFSLRGAVVNAITWVPLPSPEKGSQVGTLCCSLVWWLSRCRNMLEMQLHLSTVSGYSETTGVSANRFDGQAVLLTTCSYKYKLKLWMALQELNLFFWRKWFECYNVEFGIYDGTFVLYSKILKQEVSS